MSCDINGDGYIWKADPNTSIADESLHTAFKEALDSHGIEFSTFRADGGKEFISWFSEDDAAVQRIKESIVGKPPNSDYMIGSSPDHINHLKARLLQAGIPFEATTYYEYEYVSYLPEHHSIVNKIWRYSDTPVEELMSESNNAPKPTQ